MCVCAPAPLGQVTEEDGQNLSEQNEHAVLQNYSPHQDVQHFLTAFIKNEHIFDWKKECSICCSCF